MFTVDRLARRASARRGFTLIELMIVTAIIGILAVILLANMRHALRKAKEGRTYANLSTLRLAVNMWKALRGGSYTYVPAGALPTNGNPWSLKQGAWFNPPAVSEGWADEDGLNGFRVENGAYQERLSDFLAATPPADVSLNGNGQTVGGGTPCNGVWEANVATAEPILNGRGWHYNNITGAIRINNNSASTEGKLYKDY